MRELLSPSSLIEFRHGRPRMAACVRLLAIPAALLGLLLSIGVAFSAQPPPGLRWIFRSQFEAVAPATLFDISMGVLEWEPGAWAPPHTHSATSFITILEGEWTNIRIVDGQRTEPVVYRVGDTIVEPAWSVHEAGNLGADRARVLLTRLQPRDTPVTIDVPMESFRRGAPRPQFAHLASTEVHNMSGPVDVHQALFELPPGGRIAAHFHPGIEFAMVIEGALTVTGSATTTVPAGNSFANAVGEIVSASNIGAEKTSVVVTHVVAAGKPLTFRAE